MLHLLPFVDSVIPETREVGRNKPNKPCCRTSGRGHKVSSRSIEALPQAVPQLREGAAPERTPLPRLQGPKIKPWQSCILLLARMQDKPPSEAWHARLAGAVDASSGPAREHRLLHRSGAREASFQTRCFLQPAGLLVGKCSHRGKCHASAT